MKTETRSMTFVRRKSWIIYERRFSKVLNIGAGEHMGNC
jgi:hypothetical protein